MRTSTPNFKARDSCHSVSVSEILKCVLLNLRLLKLPSHPSIILCAKSILGDSFPCSVVEQKSILDKFSHSSVHTTLPINYSCLLLSQASLETKAKGSSL